MLITAGTVRGKGPYLFLLDPDANLTVIDQQIVEQAGLNQGRGPTRIDETGAEQMRGYAELSDLQLGTLTVSARQVMMVPSDFYNTEGRRVNGVIGRDVLADTLVFGFDREQGIATLSTLEAFKPPPDATAIKVALVGPDPSILTAPGNRVSMDASNSDDASRVGISTRTGGPALDVTPLPRRVASAKIGDVPVTMHLDLGGPVSQLREPLWSK